MGDKINKKQGDYWTAYHDPETGRCFAEIIYTSREGREQYNYELTKEVYDKLGTIDDESANIELIKECNRTYSFENTMYGTLGPERLVWDEEAQDAMDECIRKDEENK